MQHCFFIAATGTATGLTSVCLGLVRALESLGVKTAFYTPISQPNGQEPGAERSAQLVNPNLGAQSVKPIDLRYAQRQLSLGKTDALMEEILQRYHQCAEDAEVVIVEGLLQLADENYIGKLNVNMVKALNADVILVAAQNAESSAQLNERIRMTAGLFGGFGNKRLLGCILNKVGAPDPDSQQVIAGEEPPKVEVDAENLQQVVSALPVFNDTFRCLGTVRWNPSLVAPRTSDVCRYLRAEILHEGQIHERRVQSITVCARTIKNMLHTLTAGALLVTPGDREDILLGCCMAALNGVPLAGVVLTGGIKPSPEIMQLCQAAFKTGLPVMLVERNTFSTAQKLNNMNTEVPADDVERIERVKDAVAADINGAWLVERARVDIEKRLSPPAFRHLLVERARAANKRIILPEGEEPRTIQAAALCHEKGIARCVLLGRPDDVRQVAASHNVTLPEDIEIIDPDDVRQHYVLPMVALREHKGLTTQLAESMLEDTVVLATMMLAQGHVDGLVSGAVHTTANTIRPALQLIKTKPDASLVSSVFFMLLPEETVVYGDCAVNPMPDARQLADIAVQSADSARAFGIEPRVAMISYSTGQSGSGSDVEKVREATELARQMRPDYLIDGPLQYDAASVPSVAASKAPDSPVAGNATVFIFPDLNTGNTTYKAVQRSAGVVSIGPMLQGLRKPVNDLSRGATVEDIVYTIALTAIQAGE